MQASKSASSSTAWGVPHREAWVAQEHAAQALRLVLGAFRGEGIEALPVKGILLGRLLYASVEERPIADVDLRVLPRDLPHVVRIARREGWRVWRNSKQLGSRGIDVGGSLVEIESTIGPPGLCALRVEEMLQRSTVTVGALGFEHREPELHDHVLLLCVNAFKDKLVRAPPWAAEDLERIVALPGFDPRTLAERAERARFRTGAWIVADWMARRGSARWGEVRETLGAPRRGVYVRAYGALAARAPAGPAIGALARMGSDDAWRQVGALGLGAVGALAYEVTGLARKFWGGQPRR